MRPVSVVTCAALAVALNLPAANVLAQGHAPEAAHAVTGETAAHLVVEPAAHPEVAVSRSLAAQPVHPHKVKLVLNGDRPRAGTHHTWIDPDRELVTGAGGLDENHRIVRAQRLAKMRRDRPAARLVMPDPGRSVHRSGHADQSGARIVTAPPRRADHARRMPRPSMILHVPRSPDRDDVAPERAEPIAPARPHEARPKLVNAD